MPNLNNERQLAEYKARINRVIDFIDQNLAMDFSLDQLAEIACFSKYHFHRIFYTLMRETLFRFIQRLRLEKAAALLLNRPLCSITEIAYQTGFSSPQAFARSFKDLFDISASEWRRHKKTGAVLRRGKPDQEEAGLKPPPPPQIMVNGGKQIWQYRFASGLRTIEVTSWPPKRVAYLRYFGPYKGDSRLFEKLWQKVVKWAVPRDLIREDTEFLIIYHDDLNITDGSKLRTSLCLTVPEHTEARGEFGIMELAGGKTAGTRFRLKGDEYAAAWDWVYGTFLPASGYQPDDRPCFEYYPRQGNKPGPDGRITVDICIPVKAL